MIDYSYVFNDTIKYYLGDEFRLPLENCDEVNTTAIEATTMDEYLVYLIKGYINVTLEERLEKYLVELIKDEWFHQWPLVRWAYASRILNHKRSSERDLERARSILFPLAQEGYPNAMCDIAYCYCYSVGLERSYERAVCLWIEATKKGYRDAKESLKLEYSLSRSKELPEELRFFLLHRILLIFIEEHNIPVENSSIDISELPLEILKELKKIYSEYKRLYKWVGEKAYLRHCGQLCWDSEDNPYSIGIKLK